MVRACVFPTTEAKRAALQKLLREHGDDIPEEFIRKATTDENILGWSALCEDEDPTTPVSAARFEVSDWYSCTVKNLVTRRDFREQGLGRRVTHEVIKQAEAHDCKVLLADITKGNKPSEAIFKDEGFKVVDRFCWASGERPGRIYHYVRQRPLRGRCP